MVVLYAWVMTIHLLPPRYWGHWPLYQIGPVYGVLTHPGVLNCYIVGCLYLLLSLLRAFFILS